MNRTLKRTRRNLKTALLVAIVGLGGTGALFAYVKGGGSIIPPALHKDGASVESPDVAISDAQENRATAPHQAVKPRVDVATTTIDDSSQLSTTHEQVNLPAGADKYAFSVNRALANTHLLAPGAEVVSANLDKGVLTLDFTAAFDRTYGTDDESRIINSISDTLAQFKEVDKVAFTVGGKRLTTLGNSDLSEPMPVR